MSKWIGRVATLTYILGRGRTFDVRVRIIGAEQATPDVDSRNPSGFWYWATYE